MFKKIFLLISILLLSVTEVFASDDDFYTYLKQLRSNVEKNWNAPDLSRLYTSEVNFKVLKDGNIQDIRLIKSSGSKNLDLKAIEAVSGAGKQLPLPSVYNADSIDVTMQLSSNHSANVYKKVSKKKYKKSSVIVEKRPVKIKKVIYDKNFAGVSNFQDNMIQPVLNLNIQNAIKG